MKTSRGLFSALGTALALMAFMALVGCPADAIPPSGHCEGMVGPLELDVASGGIDEPSEFHFVREPEECSDPARDIFMLAYGGGAFVVDIETSSRKSVLSSSEVHPIPPLADADYIAHFDISHPNGPPAIVDGFMRMTREVSTRMTGDFNVAFEDNSVVTCTFDLPFRDHLNDQKPFGCPSSNGGGGGGGGGIGGGDWDD
jgi:hypothetical protein